MEQWQRKPVGWQSFGQLLSTSWLLTRLGLAADKQSRLHRSQRGRDVRVWILHLRYLFVAQQISQITLGTSLLQRLTSVNIENEMFAEYISLGGLNK